MSYYFKKPRFSPEESKRYEEAFESDEFKKLAREIREANEKAGVRVHRRRRGMGYGLVCKNGMPARTTAFLYCGEYGDGDADGDYYFGIDDVVGINGPGPKKTPMDLSLANHSCVDFNIEYRSYKLKCGVVIIVGVTIRDIAPGEELLSNYNSGEGKRGYWNPYHVLEKEDKLETSVLSRCLCNASNGGTCPYNFARWFRKPGHWKRKTAKSVDMLDADESVMKRTRHVEAAKTLYGFFIELSGAPISPMEPLDFLQAPPLLPVLFVSTHPIAVSAVVGAVPPIAVPPVIGAVPPIAVSPVIGAESAMAIPDPGLSERQIEPVHPPESKKKEMRGAHQAQKVEDKTYKSSAMFTKAWADRVKAKLEEFNKKYPDLVMPWGDPNVQYTPSGNTLRVLWMTLHDLDQRKIITRVSKKDGGGFYGITGFTVQDTKEFNSGEFPSIPHLLHQKSLQLKSSTEYERLEKEYKRMWKIWHEAGFKHIADRDGIVTFTYDSELRSKSKYRKSTSQGDGGVGH